MNKKVTLVGAGPGDPELITLKAIKALEQAKVVLYDALVNEELLDYAPNALKIFVGKRAGKHKFPQERINELLVQYAFSHENVVRLKGGDPFVFGRGHEELEYVEGFGIETAIVPGISSAFSVPALQQIPLTKRGKNESFWVITGTTRSREVSQDMYLAAQSSATLVILMGMKKLSQIMQILSDFGKSETPVAIIQNGSLPNEKIGIGKVNTIVEIAQQKNLAAPAIIVVGEVVTEAAVLKDIYQAVPKNEYAVA